MWRGNGFVAGRDRTVGKGPIDDELQSMSCVWVGLLQRVLPPLQPLADLLLDLFDFRA